MYIIYEEKLVKELRELCDNVKKRLWIASPFIGDWNAVRKIIGRKWIDDGAIDVKLLTDVSENGNINPYTFKCFRDRGKVKAIKGLHAKIYIVDNSAIVSSANLTSTAFSKRYEVGIMLSEKETQFLLDLYNNWWDNISEDIPLDWIPRIDHHKQNKEREETSGETLKVLWELPSDPGDPIAKLIPTFRDYELFLRYYRDFAGIYSKIQRLWPDTYLFFETDAFLNYLFHHAPGKPTQKYRRVKPRILNKDEREKEIRKYALQFKKWLSEGSEGVETTRWRQEGNKIIRTLLSKDRIEELGKKEITQVVDRLNCMNSMPLAKSMFLNSKNNDIKAIRSAWKNLLYGTAPLQARMSECKNTLKHFGRSSIQELLGFFEPDKYPIRNTNTSAGLRFFGYDISAY